jgi:hypothetical protein
MTNPLRRTAPAAVAALLCAGLVAGCGSKGDATATDHSSDGAPSTATSSTTAADSATSPTSPTSPAAPATTPGGPTRTGLVYYVTKTPMGDRLAAETTDETGSDPVSAALAALLSGTPADPDYRTALPAGSLTSQVGVDGAHRAFTLTLSGAQWEKLPSGVSAADAQLAVQQLAYTLNAAHGTTKKPLPLHFSLDGAPVTFLGQPATATQGKPLRTLSLMNVTSPVDGSTLRAGKQTFSGVGSSFEATVTWKIQDSSGKSVLHGSTMAAGWMDDVYPWKATVDLSKLPAGSYTFVASTDDPSEGEGAGPFTDSKTFTLG